MDVTLTFQSCKKRVCIVIQSRLPYAAPEVLLENNWTVKNDVYSLGIVMLEWISGSSFGDYPLNEENFYSSLLFSKKIKGESGLLKSLHKALDSIGSIDSYWKGKGILYLLIKRLY